MSALMNPILERTLDLLRQGRVPKVISPERSQRSNKKVTFVFDDDSQEVLQTQTDHQTFMDWWELTTGYLRQCVVAFKSPTDAG